MVSQLASYFGLVRTAFRHRLIFSRATSPTAAVCLPFRSLPFQLLLQLVRTPAPTRNNRRILHQVCKQVRISIAVNNHFHHASTDRFLTAASSTSPRVSRISPVCSSGDVSSGFPSSSIALHKPKVRTSVWECRKKNATHLRRTVALQAPKRQYQISGRHVERRQQKSHGTPSASRQTRRHRTTH